MGSDTAAPLLSRAERTGFGLVTGVAVVLWALLPVLPTYDTLASLVWAQELLSGQMPGFDDYRAPTEHPLWLVLSVFTALFGDAGARVMTLVSVLSFVALGLGLYLLVRTAWGRLAAVVAVVLLFTRLNLGFWAAFAFLDIAFAALIVWAAVLEAQRERRGGLVWVLLIAAGLLRPEGWVVAGLYGVCVAWRRPLRDWAKVAALVAAAPLLWIATDFVVTGHPLFSFTYTTDEAAKLGRQRGLLELPEVWLKGLREVLKLPVLVAGLVGAVTVAVELRRQWSERSDAARAAGLVAALVVIGTITFSLVVLGGVSGQVPRYTILCSIGLIACAARLVSLLFGAARAEIPRWAWAGAVVLLLLGAGWTATRIHPRSVTSEMRFRVDLERDLLKAIELPATQEAMKCGDLTVANHRLVPAARWYLDGAPVQTRTDPEVLKTDDYGPTLLMLGSRALGNGGYGSFDGRMYSPALQTQVPPEDALRAGRTEYFALYARCR